MKANILLSDRFAEFTKQIRALHEEKKRLTEEFKEVHERWKADMAALDRDAENLHNQFVEWEQQQKVDPKPHSDK